MSGVINSFNLIKTLAAKSPIKSQLAALSYASNNRRCKLVNRNCNSVNSQQSRGAKKWYPDKEFWDYYDGGTLFYPEEARWKYPVPLGEGEQLSWR